MPPTVFSKAQTYADQTLNEAVGAANKQLLKDAPIMPKEQATREQQIATGIAPISRITIPTFTGTKTEARRKFQDWYRGLSATDKDAVRQQLGGQ